MNQHLTRQMKRQQERKTVKQPTYNMSATQLGGIIHQQIESDLITIKQQAVRDAAGKVTAVFLIALHDTYNFHTKRLKKVLQKADELFCALEYEGFSVDDLYKQCIEEFGIEVKL